MKNSRTSLNKPFYDWIKEVREADKKIEELEEKLYYYNVKLVGYNSPNFEPRLSSTKPEYKDNRYIWIDKINKVEKQLHELENKKINFFCFIKKLDEIKKGTLLRYISKSKSSRIVISSRDYKILNDIARVFDIYK